MRSTVSISVKPVLLGGGALSLRVAISLLSRYMLSSYVFAKGIPFYRRLLIFISFKPLHDSDDDRFTLMALDHFVKEYGESTYLLIPCQKKYEELVERNRDRLENKFIIRSPEEILAKGDIFPLAATNGKDL